MSGEPRITVLVTAHNAAATIGKCLRSVAAQRGLEPGSLEVVLVDDRSSDGTSEAAKAAGLASLRIIRVERPRESGLTTRQDALALGIAAARGEIVMTLDADGIASPDWAASMAQPILTGRVDAVAGPVAFHAEHGWLGIWQTVDAAHYMAVCEVLNALGLSAGVMFGNFAFRRALYDEVGGFERIGFALTEDLAFARALHAHGARLAYLRGAEVGVDACESWSVLIERAKRVSSGGVSALAVSIGLWMALLPILAVAALLFGGFWGWLLLIRFVAGAMFTAYAVLRVGKPSLLLAAVLYEPLATAIGVRVMAGLRRSNRVEWGGKSYAR